MPPPLGPAKKAGAALVAGSLALQLVEGYADPAFVRAFEESHQCEIAASYVGSSDELVAKLRGGSASDYDILRGPRTAVHVFPIKKRRPSTGIRFPTPSAVSAWRVD